MNKKSGDRPGVKLICQNRKARHEYEILDTFEAGLVLTGTEVKSLRDGRASLGDAYAKIKDGELWFVNCHISEYLAGNRYNHDPLRQRKLLMHRREIFKLNQKINERGLTLIPLSMYFVRGRAKVELALAKGKRVYDKREDIKKRDEKRALDRLRRV